MNTVADRTVADRIEPTLPPRFRISVDKYQKKIQTGVLGRSDRVELIEGEMFQVALIGARHAAISRRLNALLSRSVAPRGLPSVQMTVRDIFS